MPSTETKHLTSLNFDLSQMQSQLASIPASVEESARKASEAWNNNFKMGSGASAGTNAGGSDFSVSATQSKIESLMLSYKNFQASLANSKMEPVGLQKLRTEIETSISSIGRLSESMSTNGKLAKAESAEYQSLVSSLKKLKGAYADIKTDASDNQKGTQGETVITASKAQLESLILQYKNFEATLSRTKIYPEAIGTLKTQAAEATTSLVGLTDKLDANGKLTGESAKQYQDFTSKLKGAKGEFADLSKKANEAAGATNNVGAAADKAGGFVQNFLGKLADKARWLAAFYLIQSIINGFQQLVSTVKDTETAVVGIQRVLNEEVSSANVSKELYAIAYEYGRTFEEVQNSATLFAQTGKSWNDVLTLTRGTMLALNTAELDVTQATEGLIAVMAQWNLGAEDYVGVIDRINKTADDYAITSEKIVAALQRSGGTAKAYGMTLDELIGIITALGEATGRSGENIGTAINSLITYTTKAKSITVLEDMGVQAKDAEGNLLPVLEIWSQLAQKIKGGDLAFADFMASDQEAVDSFLADSEEYQQAVKDTIASGKEVQDAYSIAGTYRKNYFIALLNNLGTAEEAMRGMADAEGYSATENEKYMASLAAISNQLSSAWKQLAVEFGDAGFLDMLKWVAEFGIGIAKLINNTGGLMNALYLVLGVLIMIKAQKIQETLTGWGTAIKNVATGFKTATTAAQVFQTAVGWIGLITTAISLLVGAVNGVNSAIEQHKAKLLEAGDAARQNTQSINDLINKYVELANSSDFALGNESALASAKSIHEDIVEILGEQASGWDLVNGKVDDNIAKLRAAQLENATLNRNDILAAKTVAESQLNSFKQIALGQVNIIQSALKQSGNEDWRAGANAELQFAAMKDGADGVLAILREWQSDFLKLGEDGASALAIVSAQIAYYEGLIKDADTATKNFAENEAMIKSLETLRDGTINTQAEFDNYIELLNQAELQERVTAEYADALRAAMADLYPEFSSVGDSIIEYNDALSEGSQANGLFTTSLETMQKQMDDWSSQIDNAQSSLKTLQDIVSEYNETGLMSVDMLQQLLELDPEYVALLDFTASGLQMNEEATRNLIDAKKELIDASLALKSAEMAEAIAAEFTADGHDDAYYAAKGAASAASAQAAGLQELINSAYSAGYSTQYIAQKLYELGYIQDVTGSKAGAMVTAIMNASRAMYNYGAAAQFAGSSLSSLATWTGASAGKTSGGGGGGGGGEDPQIKILEDRKKAIEEEAQAQIDALKKVQEAEDRKRKHEEYAADRSEALADVRRAQSRSGADAREDEFESEKKLAELDKDWQDQLKDWNLDDQIAAIEEWKDAMVEAIEAQIDALQSSGGGGGGGGSIANVFGSEAEVLTQNKDVLLNALLEMDNENLPEKIKAFYQLFDASQYTSDVDFGEQLAGIKSDWDTFEAENGDKFAIHYKTVLDDGTSLTPEKLAEYTDWLLDGAVTESDILKKDQSTGGLGILLRITTDEETTKETEDQWSQTVNDLGEALNKILELWEFDNLDLDAAKKAIEDAFNNAFDAAEQAATDSGVVIEEQMASAADSTGASMLSAVNGYSPQIVDSWNKNLINPMITSLGDLSGTLDGILGQLGQVAAFGGIQLGGTGLYGSTSNTSNTQTNFVTLNGRGRNQTDPLAKWFI